MSWTGDLIFTEVSEWDITRWRASEAFGACAHRYAPNVHTLSEFSFQAGDTARANGFVAFEHSAHPSSDSVYVVNHDADTADQYTSTLTIATSTLAALQGLTRKYGSSGEPMHTLEESLERYGSYVGLVENKAYGASSGQWTDFFNLLLAQPNATERIVFKAFYDASSRLAQAKTLGFTTWAYAFGTTQAEDLVTNYYPLGNIDWVGFSSGPSNAPTDQVWWDWAATNNVPVISHVGVVSADWTSMKAQGADMGMINNPTLYPLT